MKRLNEWLLNCKNSFIFVEIKEQRTKMNREIKFRAWLPEFKKMEADLFGLRSDGMTSFNSDAVLMQFTGLKDSAGKEIYEGDIVRVDCSEVGGAYHDGVYKVTYLLPDCGFFLEQLDQLNAIAFNECYQYEVIGNVFKNPELLTK